MIQAQPKKTGLEVAIRTTHRHTRETCSSERLQSDLADQGIQAGVNRIKRIRNTNKAMYE